MRTLDSLTFDTTGLAQDPDQGNTRIWLAPDQDIYALHYYPVPPNIDAALQDIDAVRARYREVARQAGGAIIEVDVRSVDGCDVVVVLIKVPQKPAGMRTEPPVSVPMAKSTSLPATAAAEPLDDPPGTRPGAFTLVGVP